MQSYFRGSALRTQHPALFSSEAISILRPLHFVVRKLMTIPSLPSFNIFHFLAPRSPYLFKVSIYELSAMSYEPSASWNGLFCFRGPRQWFLGYFFKWPGLISSLLTFARKTSSIWPELMNFLGPRTQHPALFIRAGGPLLERSGQRFIDGRAW